MNENEWISGWRTQRMKRELEEIFDILKERYIKKRGLKKSRKKKMNEGDWIFEWKTTRWKTELEEK